MDIENSRNKTTDKKAREELGNLSVIFWQDQYFVENYEIDTSLEEENKYRDYYQGYTSLQFPAHEQNIHFMDGYTRYEYHTSKTSGSVKTPWYGQPFDKEKFEYSYRSHYYIFSPSNIADITDTHPGLTFVLDFYVDVALYKQVGTDIEKIYLELDDDGKLEDLIQTGNISVIRKYATSRMSKRKYIQLFRRLDKTLVEKSVEKRNTGFQLSWYYEDGDGKRVDIEQEARYKQEPINKRFIKFMNMLYEAVTKHGISLDTLWDTAKRYRLDYIHRKVDNNVGICLPHILIGTDDYFNYFSSNLETLQDQPVYNENITDSLLSVGFQLFHYIARCEDMDQNSIQKFKTILKTFKDGSSMKILETANEIFNIDKTQKKGRAIWRQSSAGNLMKKMNEIFGLNIHKSEVLSADNLEDIRDDEIRRLLNICMKEEECEELKRLGEYSLLEYQLWNIHQHYLQILLTSVR